MWKEAEQVIMKSAAATPFASAARTMAVAVVMTLPSLLAGHWIGEALLLFLQAPAQKASIAVVLADVIRLSLFK